MTNEHDCVLNVRDRNGATTEQVLPDLQAPTFAARVATVVAKDAVLVPIGSLSLLRPRLEMQVLERTT